jgi:hypothetical protein
LQLIINCETGFAEIVLKSEMTGSSAAKRAEATGLHSTVTARPAGQIAMQGEFALSKPALDVRVRDLAAARLWRRSSPPVS